MAAVLDVKSFCEAVYPAVQLALSRRGMASQLAVGREGIQGDVSGHRIDLRFLGATNRSLLVRPLEAGVTPIRGNGTPEIQSAMREAMVWSGRRLQTKPPGPRSGHTREAASTANPLLGEPLRVLQKATEEFQRGWNQEVRSGAWRCRPMSGDCFHEFWFAVGDRAARFLLEYREHDLVEMATVVDGRLVHRTTFDAPDLVASCAAFWISNSIG